MDVLVLLDRLGREGVWGCTEADVKRLVAIARAAVEARSLLRKDSPHPAAKRDSLVGQVNAALAALDRALTLGASPGEGPRDGEGGGPEGGEG